MTPDNQPAWHGLFPDHDFEFRFGARPGDAVAFSADTSEHDTLMAARRNSTSIPPATSRALLFGIRLVNVSLAGLKQFPEAQAGLHRAIATMLEEVAAYKNVTAARAHLLELLS